MTVDTQVTGQQPSARARELIRTLVQGVQDPYPLYAELREIGDGIHWVDEFQGYMVTRYEHVKRLTGNHQVFSNDIFFDSAASTHDPGNDEHVRFVDAASRVFMFADPPEHTRIRSTFRHAFTPHSIEAWRPLVESVTRELLTQYRPGDEFDAMAGLASEVPVAVIAEILGIPAEKRSEFRRWSYAYASTFDPLIQGDRRSEAIAIAIELFDYLGDLVAERRSNPRNDLITTLISTPPARGEYLADVELLAQLALLLVAGNESTTTLIASGLSMLFDYPDVRRRIQEDHSTIPDAVEEMLRFDAPFHFVIRKSCAPTRLGAHDFPEGTLLYPSPAAANRDPRQFQDPGTFTIDRTDNKHVSFVHGIHFCVGAPLARMEAQVVFEYLLRAFPEIRPGTVPAERRVTNSVSRGWVTRPVVL